MKGQKNGRFDYYQTPSRSNQTSQIFSVPHNQMFPSHHIRPKYTRTTSRLSSIPSTPSATSSSTQCFSLLRAALDRRQFSLRTISVMLLSYTGAAALATLLTAEYFHYYTTTRIEIISPNHSELPAFSVCLFYILPEIRLEKTHDNWLESSLTLGEIDSRLPKFDEFVIDCKVLDSNYKYKSCINITPNVTEYLSLYSKCYTLFEKMDPIVYEDGKVGSNFLIKLRLNTKNLTTNTLAIFINHRTEELREAYGNPGFLQLECENKNEAIATYERTVIKSLESPYDSGCRDYSKEPCFNRNTCLKRCILNSLHKSIKRFDTNRYVKLFSNRLDGRFGVRNESFDTQVCRNKFTQPPCNEYIYRAISGIQIYSPFMPNGTFEFSLSYPLGTEIRVQYVPYRPFLDYLIFVFSVIALWTEFSVSRTLYKFSNCLQSGILKRMRDFICYR
uniref:Uncharacterized protein n=1 Tax=Tetranychus urticae TaxID=32264 RepID=T1JRC4_TETUR